MLRRRSDSSSRYRESSLGSTARSSSTTTGVIESAGTYLRVDADIPALPSGLGARHTAAAAITAVSEAVAVAISESTRQVSIFRHGRRVVVL